MILIAIGTGIGAGIIIDGALYRGASEASGEIGNMLPGSEFLGKQLSKTLAPSKAWLRAPASLTGHAACSKIPAAQTNWIT